MKRTREYRREVRQRAITRKKRLRIAIADDDGDWYKFDGQYSKGKVHCSCRMCTYSKYHGLPRYKDMVDKDRVRDAKKDLK